MLECRRVQAGLSERAPSACRSAVCAQHGPMDRSAIRTYLVGARDFTVAHEVLAKFVVVALLFTGRAAERKRVVLSRWVCWSGVGVGERGARVNAAAAAAAAEGEDDDRQPGLHVTSAAHPMPAFHCRPRAEPARARWWQRLACWLTPRPTKPTGPWTTAGGDGTGCPRVPGRSRSDC